MALSYRPTTLDGKRLQTGYDYIAPSPEPDPFEQQADHAAKAAKVARGSSPLTIAAVVDPLKRPPAIAGLVVVGLVALVNKPAAAVLLVMALLVIYLNDDPDTSRTWWPLLLGELGLAPLANDELPQRTPILRTSMSNGFLMGTLLGGEDDRRQLLKLQRSPVERCTSGAEAAAHGAFSPSFITWFAVHGLPFECEDGHLMVYVPYLLRHRVQFRELMARADHIYAALSGHTPAATR